MRTAVKRQHWEKKESDIRRFQISTDLIAETFPRANGLFGVGSWRKAKE
jgi:hypothetical protein